MRESMSAFDVRRIRDELRNFIGARCRKAYQPHYEQVVLRLGPKEGSPVDLVMVLGRRVYISARERPMPQQPAPFAQLLRKYLTNTRLIGVEQSSFDRILILEFESGRGIHRLVVEMFRDGNLILMDGDGTIIRPLTHREYRARTLKGGVAYELPPAPIDPYDLTADSLETLLGESVRSLTRTLAAVANLGRTHAEAVATLAGVSKEKRANELNADERRNVMASLSTLLKELSIQGGGGHILFKEGESMQKIEEAETPEAKDRLISEEVSDVTPVLLPEHKELAGRHFSTLSEAWDSAWGRHDAAAFARREAERSIESQEKEAHLSGEGKLERRLDQQKRAVEEFSNKAIYWQGLGQSIQESWTHVDELLTQVRKGVEERGWDEVESLLHDSKWIREVNPAEHSLIAIIPDESGVPSKTEVVLNVEQSVHQNAQRHFDEGRKWKNKMEGLMEAISETEAAISKRQKVEAKREASGQLPRIKRAKRLWFERFHWTVLSTGQLFIGGRDAKTNDGLVRKHLNLADLYFHADLHGAPSCTLKSNEGLEVDTFHPPNIPDDVTCLRLTQHLTEGAEGGNQVIPLSDESAMEAAQASLVWSRAWAAGSGGHQVYWVKPGQVSKRAESGEALARGAFIIRGQRNWLRGMPLEWALGPVVVNGTPLMLGGTRRVVESHCSRWILLAPGRNKKEDMANRLSKATGIATDDILGIVPGNCEVVTDNGLLIPFKPKVSSEVAFDEEE